MAFQIYEIVCGHDSFLLRGQWQLTPYQSVDADHDVEGWQRSG